MLPSAVRNRFSLIDLLEELGALSSAPLVVCATRASRRQLRSISTLSAAVTDAGEGLRPIPGPCSTVGAIVAEPSGSAQSSVRELEVERSGGRVPVFTI